MQTRLLTEAGSAEAGVHQAEPGQRDTLLNPLFTYLNMLLMLTALITLVWCLLASSRAAADSGPAGTEDSLPLSATLTHAGQKYRYSPSTWMWCSLVSWCGVQIEGQQAERNQAQQEKQALQKLERIKLDQGKRAEDLEQEAAVAESKVCCMSCLALPCCLPGS